MQPEMKTLTPSEIQQLDVDAGLLHEANRSLFHPLGMELVIENNQLLLKRGNPEDTYHEVLDREKLLAFRRWSLELHKRRSAKLTFLIQVNSMQRQPTEEQSSVGTLPQVR